MSKSFNHSKNVTSKNSLCIKFCHSFSISIYATYSNQSLKSLYAKSQRTKQWMREFFQPSLNGHIIRPDPSPNLSVVVSTPPTFGCWHDLNGPKLVEIILTTLKKKIYKLSFIITPITLQCCWILAVSSSAELESVVVQASLLTPCPKMQRHMMLTLLLFFVVQS